MNQGNPEVRPTTKVHEDRTKEEGNTAGTPNNCTAATSRAATQPAAHTHTEQKHRKTARHKNTSEQSQTDRPQGHSSQARTDRQTSPFRLRFKEKKKKEERKKKRKPKTTKSPWNRLIIMNMCKLAERLEALQCSS